MRYQKDLHRLPRRAYQLVQNLQLLQRKQIPLFKRTTSLVQYGTTRHYVAGDGGALHQRRRYRRSQLFHQVTVSPLVDQRLRSPPIDITLGHVQYGTTTMRRLSLVPTVSPLRTRREANCHRASGSPLSLHSRLHAENHYPPRAEHIAFPPTAIAHYKDNTFTGTHALI